MRSFQGPGPDVTITSHCVAVAAPGHPTTPDQICNAAPWGPDPPRPGTLSRCSRACQGRRLHPPRAGRSLCASRGSSPALSPRRAVRSAARWRRVLCGVGGGQWGSPLLSRHSSGLGGGGVRWLRAGADSPAVVVSVGGTPSLLSDPHRQLRARLVSRGALAEFEKALIAERTKAGLAAAKRRGVKVGRKQELTAAQVGHARTLFASGEGARLLLERWGDPGQLSIAPSHDFRNLLDVLEVEPRAM